MNKQESLTKNYILNLFYQVLVIILPLVTVPYISRILGSYGIGVYSYTYSIAYYFSLFAMLGINYYGNRKIAKVRDEQEELNKTFSSLFYMQITNTFLVSIIYIIYAIFINKENYNITIIQGLNILATGLDVTWLLYGLEKFKITIARSVIVKLITITLIFVFVKSINDLEKYTFILSIGNILSQIILWINLKKYVKFVKVKKNEILEKIKPCVYLFMAVISISLFKNMDKVMLGIFTNMNEVGYYENANKITSAILKIVTALGVVMLPKMANLFEKGKNEKGKEYIFIAIKYSIIISSAMVFGIISISGYITKILFGDEFSQSKYIINALAVSILFSAIATIVRTTCLIPMEKDKIYVRSIVIGAIVNIIMNFILINKYKAIGVAISSVIAEFTVMMYQMIKINKELQVWNSLKKNVPYIIFGIIMMLVVEGIQYFKIENIIIRVSIQILIGAIVYSLECIIYFKYIDIEIIKYMKKVLRKIR